MTEDQENIIALYDALTAKEAEFAAEKSKLLDRIGVLEAEIRRKDGVIECRSKDVKWGTMKIKALKSDIQRLHHQNKLLKQEVIV